jgi:hypothetical protein
MQKQSEKCQKNLKNSVNPSEFFLLTNSSACFCNPQHTLVKSMNSNWCECDK